MNDNIIILIALIVAGTLFLLVEFLKQRKKDRQPIYTYRATLRSKSVVATSTKGVYGPVNVRSYVVTFDLADGSRVELTAPEEIVKYPDGTTGTVIFQGTKCERFDPDP